MAAPFVPMYQPGSTWPNPLNNPFNQYQFNQPTTPSFAQQQSNLIRVSGRQGAEAYQLPPNSAVPLFDGDSDTLYIKSTDGAGFGTIHEYQIVPKQADPNPMTGYVTQEQFDELQKEIESVKHSIQQSQSEPVTVSFANAERNASYSGDAWGQSGKHGTASDATQSAI